MKNKIGTFDFCMLIKKVVIIFHYNRLKIAI